MKQLDGTNEKRIIQINEKQKKNNDDLKMNWHFAFLWETKTKKSNDFRVQCEHKLAKNKTYF